MKQRLIDANALKKAFCNHCDGDEPCTEPCVDIGLIETAPAVDAVPVVKCLECKHHDVFKNGVNGWCNKHGCPTDVTYFCADGERKEQERE